MFRRFRSGWRSPKTRPKRGLKCHPTSTNALPPRQAPAQSLRRSHPRPTARRQTPAQRLPHPAPLSVHDSHANRTLSASGTRPALRRALACRIEFALPQNPDAHGAARMQICRDGKKRMARRLVGLQFGPLIHALRRSPGQGARTVAFLQFLLPSLAQLAGAMEPKFTASGRGVGKTLGSYCPLPPAKALQASSCRAPGSTSLAPILSALDRLQSRSQKKVNRSKP